MGNSSVLRIYQFIVGLLFWAIFPLLLIGVMITGAHRRGLMERLGCYRFVRPARETKLFWLHAASIGEVGVARKLIDELRGVCPESSFLLTTMTIHGRDYARRLLSDSIAVYLAPLDVPGVVGRVVRMVRPSVYVCLETELWPILLHAIKRSGAAAVLLNGRVSDRSIRSYRRVRSIIEPLLKGYDLIAAIDDIDQERFLALGAHPETVAVTGNVKHDATLPEHPEMVRRRWLDCLDVPEGKLVVVAGSTHPPEEAMLLPLCARFADREYLWLVAPRHLQRLPAVVRLLEGHDVAFDRLSDLLRGRKRRYGLVLVDTMGDLAELYSVAAIAFIGGSLVEYGGHNVLEAARWGAVVLFGPSTEDFREAAAILEKSGGGIRVTSEKELGEQIGRLLCDSDDLRRRSALAAQAAGVQSGVVRRQAEMVAGIIGCSAAAIHRPVRQPHGES